MPDSYLTGGIDNGRLTLVPLFFIPLWKYPVFLVLDQSEPGARSELASRLEAGLSLARFVFSGGGGRKMREGEERVRLKT